MQKPFTGYLLATHGRRGLHRDHPAVRQQIANLEAFAKQWSRHIEIETHRTVFIADYARSVRGLNSLPRLRDYLQQGGPIIIDDASRLFRACPDAATQRALWEELSPYHSAILHLRLMKPLSEVTGAKRELLVRGALRADYSLAPRRRSQLDLEDRRDQTALATTASSKARRRASHKAGEQLSRVKASIESDDETATLAKIAARANDEGLRTSRGTLWRTDSVSRALKRYDGGEE